MNSASMAKSIKRVSQSPLKTESLQERNKRSYCDAVKSGEFELNDTDKQQPSIS